MSTLPHAPGSFVDTYVTWDLIRCSPSCQPTWWPWRVDSSGWRFKRCEGCRTLWVWDGSWREALSPAALARLEADVLRLARIGATFRRDERSRIWPTNPPPDA